MTETIGQQLKLRREGKNLTIQKVVQATHIRAYQIEAIEADAFESFPSPVQARAFIRLYAEFLGLSVEEMILQQRAVVEKTSAALTDIPPATFDLAEIFSNKNTEPQQEKIRTIGIQSNRVLSLINRVVPHKKVSALPTDPGEVSNHLEPFKTEEEETILPSETMPIPAPIDLPSHLIFNNIGKTIRQRRESLSLTLDEIERHTHVRKHYLQALEDGEFDQLPSSIQARGMLNNYAHFLDLDVDTLLLTFAEGLQNQRLERQPKPDEKSRKPISKLLFRTILPIKIKIPAALRRYFSVDIFVGGGLVLLLLTFAIWGTSRIINLRAGTTLQPTPPSISILLVSTPEAVPASPSSTSGGNSSSTEVLVTGVPVNLTLPAPGHGPVQVVVVALKQAWVRVTVDGKVQFSGLVTAGTAYPFDGNTQIEVLTGDGRNISILYNQNNLGPMGNYGEVVDHIYTANAILNPTATYTPTPTITQTPTITLRSTVTLRPSATPQPSATLRITVTPGQ